MTREPVGFVRVPEDPYEHAAAVLWLAVAFAGEPATDSDIADQLARQDIAAEPSDVARVRALLDASTR